MYDQTRDHKLWTFINNLIKWKKVMTNKDNGGLGSVADPI